MLLRDKITRGELTPGERLIENNVSADLGISRASLREVLRLLEAERLLELVPNRGYSVVELDLTAVEQIHAVWSLLTGDAVFAFTQRVKPPALKDLRAIARDLAGNDDDTIAALDRINRLFNTILEGCGNQILCEVVWGLVARINVLRARSFNKAVALRWAHEFEQLLDAIAAGSAEKARSLSRAHIAGACDLAKAAALESNAALAPQRREDKMLAGAS